MHLVYLSLIFFFFKERNLENDLGYHVQKDWNKWSTCYNINTLTHTLETGFQGQVLTLRARSFREVQSY